MKLKLVHTEMLRRIRNSQIIEKKIVLQHLLRKILSAVITMVKVGWVIGSILVSLDFLHQFCFG